MNWIFTQIIKFMLFQLCWKERDLLSGIEFEHDAIMQLIEKRCNRLIAVITPDFLRTPQNDFLLKFAQAESISKRRRMVIPCIYKPVDELPPQIKYCSKLNYNNFQDPELFYKKIYASTQTPTDNRPKWVLKKLVIFHNYWYSKIFNFRVNAVPSCVQRKLEQCEEWKKCNKLEIKCGEVENTQEGIKKIDLPVDKQMPQSSKKSSKLSFLRIKKKQESTSKSSSQSESLPELPSLTSLGSLSSESPITCSSSGKKEKKKKILVQCKEKVQSLLVKSWLFNLNSKYIFLQTF